MYYESFPGRAAQDNPKYASSSIINSSSPFLKKKRLHFRRATIRCWLVRCGFLCFLKFWSLVYFFDILLVYGRLHLSILADLVCEHPSLWLKNFLSLEIFSLLAILAGQPVWIFLPGPSPERASLTQHFTVAELRSMFAKRYTSLSLGKWGWFSINLYIWSFKMFNFAMILQMNQLFKSDEIFNK